MREREMSGYHNIHSQSRVEETEESEYFNIQSYSVDETVYQDILISTTLTVFLQTQLTGGFKTHPTTKNRTNIYSSYKIDILVYIYFLITFSTLVFALQYMFPLPSLSQ